MESNFKQTDIGLIPEDWDYLKLGDEDKKLLLTIQNGCTEEQNEIEGDYLVSRIETISDEKIDLLKTKYVKEISEDKIDKYLIKKGDILFSHINSDPHLGKTAIAYKDYDNLLHGMNLLLFHSNEDILNPEFLNFIFNYYRRIGVFLKIRSRAVNQSSINQGKLKSLEIPVPTLPEQKKIAYILSKIQTAIETQEQIIKTTQELKRALMQKLFTEGLYGEQQKQTEIGLIPVSWEVKEFIDYVILQRGKDLPKYDFKAGDIPVAGSNGIIGHHSIAFVKAPGVTVGRSGSCGSVIFYEIDFWAHNTVLYVKDFKGNNPRFVFYHLQFIDLSRFKSGVSVPTLNRNAFSSMQIGIPSINEQKKIALSLNHIDEKLTLQQFRLNQFKELFKSSLNKLMTGQIRVKDIEF